MISFIKGIVEEIDEYKVVLDHEGMGFEISCPTGVLQSLETGDEVRLYTYLNVREDDMSLFGFGSRDEKLMFQLLIGVSGIGPKVAVGILSALAPDEIRFAVLGDDVKTICKAPGIGKKTAQKMILELKDKFNLEDVLTHQLTETESPKGKAPAVSGASEDAIAALMALGYSSTESLNAVKNVKATEDMSTDAILKAALKYLF